MTVVGLDDTDSRERGMCTTYVAHRIAERLDRADATVERLVLVRLNPAVEYKTRGNAALAIHADCDEGTAFSLARDALDDLAETADDRTNPGLVVADLDPGDVPDDVVSFAREAVRDHHAVDDALSLLERRGYRHAGWGVGRGRIGALAAVGAWRALGDWTYELLSYREPGRWGTPREVDAESVFAAADDAYPRAWDTVDSGEGETVCVPHTPGPILHGIRGDDPAAVRDVARDIKSEHVDRTGLFVTNQGTDAHLRDVDGIAALADGRSYRVDGAVASEPETRRGGHAFVDLVDDAFVDSIEGDELANSVADARTNNTPVGNADARLTCVAFEPTKRFRDRVRALRPGDRLTVCGEVARGALKLEKFAVRDLVRTERVTPTCPDCDRTMESAGRGQGYRCRDCGTSADGPATATVDRDLEEGWYEVPPCARRHVAKPLIRGGFDAPTHPER